jgi:uncharacterized protein RhaS with RHS repeats
MPKNGFKGDLLKHKAARSRQNLRTFQNIQERRADYDKAHRLPEGTTNSRSKRFKVAPVSK